MIFASCNKKNISRFLSLLLYFRKKTVFTGMQHSRPIVRTTPAPMWWCREELNPKTSLQLSICYNIIYHYYTYIMLYAFCAHIFSVIWLMVLYLALKKLGMDGYWSHGIQVSCMQNQAACRYMSHWISHPSRVQHIAA